MERRLPSIVDLTSGSSPSSSYLPSPDHVQLLTDSASTRRGCSRPRGSEPLSRGVKRRRLDGIDIFQASSSSSFSPRATGPTQTPHLEDIDLSNIQSVDLTEVNDSSSLAKVLAKQQEDAIKAQAGTQGATRRSILTSYKCPVCMDALTDATSTVCG
jgi:hypothetical protein